MFTNKSNDGRNNVCGTVIEKRRKEMGKSSASWRTGACLIIKLNALELLEKQGMINNETKSIQY